MEKAQFQQWVQRWRQGVVIVILINLLLVGFNATYISLRGIYLQYSPVLVNRYDAMKGIEPHPVTQHYLETVDALRREVNQNPLSSSSVQPYLRDLRAQSVSLIGENPFFESGQADLSAKLNRQMRGYVGTLSAKDAFQTFWTQDYLEGIGWDNANRFLQEKVEPLLQQSYFRETLPTGQFVDQFWIIDLIFMAFFGAEFLGRTFFVSRRQKELSWGNAIARRWYELPLVLPFWRWMRIVPALVRLHRSQLLNVERFIAQISHEPAAYLSERVSQYFLVRVVDQTQQSVRQGTILPESNVTGRIVVGDRNKVDHITDELIRITSLRVAPAIKPDFEDLLRYSLEKALTSSEIYAIFQSIPGFDAMPDNALDSISNYLAQTTCTVLAESYSDAEGRILFDQLSQRFRRALKREIQEQTSSQPLKTYLMDLLEEIKVNYIQQSKHQDPEATMDRLEQLEQTTPSTAQVSSSNSGT
jgi:hypothetical protein